MLKNINLLNQTRPHESGEKHVSGFAKYTDDILEPNGILYGAIGWSDKAHALIKKIDLNEKINLNNIAVVPSQMGREAFEIFLRQSQKRLLHRLLGKAWRLFSKK